MSDFFHVKNPFSEIKRGEVEENDVESPFDRDMCLVAKAPDCDDCFRNDLIRIIPEELGRINGENLLRIISPPECFETTSVVIEPVFTESIIAPPDIAGNSQPNAFHNDKLSDFKLNLNPPEEFVPIKRVDRIRRDDDTVPIYSVTLNDIDQAIEIHMKDNIKATVEENSGDRVRIPILYANPERWKAMRRDGFLRDKRGQIQYPLIAYKRSNLTKNEELSRPNRLLDFQFPVVFSGRNRYDRFSVLNSITPVKEIHNIVFPDHVIVTYDVTIWTEYVEHMNEVIEQFNWASEEYWGDKQETKIRRLWRTNVSDFSTPIEVAAGEDRLVKCEFTLTTFAHLLPKAFACRATTQKQITPRKVIFNFELDTSLPAAVVPDRPSGIATRFEINPNNPDGAVLASAAPASLSMRNFLQINNEKDGVLLTANDADGNFVVNFANTKLLPTPCFLIGTIRDTDKFNLLINNLFVEKSIIKFEQSGDDFIIKISNSDFTLPPSSTFTLIGKIS